MEAVIKGCENLGKHIENIGKFGVPVVVGINDYVTDTENEHKEIINFCKEKGVECRISSHWEKGGEGAATLAEEVVRLVAAKLDRLIEVVEVEDISDLDHVYREMVLIKVTADNEKRGEILQLSNIFNVKTVDVGSDQMTIETTGESNEIESLLELLEPYGIIEVMRTGRVAVLKSKE